MDVAESLHSDGGLSSTLRFAVLVVVRCMSVRHVRVLCRNGERYGHSYYEMRVGNRTQAVEWYHFQYP